ncbi:hypothetical protein MMC19_004764 [Ptychographa xylographoides]|nr:hypothetical protein [Ptychographa xylographoides]
MDKYHSNTKILLPLRGVALLFTIIELGLTAYGVSIFDGTYTIDFTTYYVNFSALNFLLFNSLWTLLVLVYLFVSLRMTKIGHPFVVLAVVAVTMLFWFAGWVALAAFLGGSLKLACDFGGTACGVLDAATAFGAFLWLIFLVDTVLAALAVTSGRSSNSNNISQPMQAA